MNNDFVIISDSSCDLDELQIKKYDVDIIPYYISLDGINYLKEKEELPIRELYEKLDYNSALYPKTALPSIGDYQKKFEKYLQNNKDIICFCLSSKFSGSFNSAVVAKNNLIEKYPNNKITIIDSKVATALQALLVIEVSRMRDNNVPYDVIINIIPKLIESGRIYFTVGNLEYLTKGGRVGKLTGMLGDKINLKPIIILYDGELQSGGVAFTRKKSYLKAINMAMDYFKNNDLNIDDYNFSTGYGLSYEEGYSFYEKIKLLFNKKEVVLIQIGATIGIYTGPYPIGLAFIRKYEKLI